MAFLTIFVKPKMIENTSFLKSKFSCLLQVTNFLTFHLSFKLKKFLVSLSNAKLEVFKNFGVILFKFWLFRNLHPRLEIYNLLDFEHIGIWIGMSCICFHT